MGDVNWKNAYKILEVNSENKKVKTVYSFSNDELLHHLMKQQVLGTTLKS
jgi:hypothetical protein